MNSIFYIGVIGVLFIVCRGQVYNRHMICKDVDSVFSENSGAVSHSKELQGPPGKRGQPGEKGGKGSPGIRGQPGIVDYGRIKEIVQAEVNAEISELKNKVEKLEHHINTTRKPVESGEKAVETIADDECSSTYSGLIHDGKCYWGEVLVKGIDFDKGKSLCASKQSTLADIYTKEHFDSMMTLLRSKIGSSPSAVIWTAMTKKFNDPDAYLSTEEKAQYTKVRSSSSGQWFPASKDRTQVYLYVRNTPKSTDQGMGAIFPSYKAKGVLCRVV